MGFGSIITRALISGAIRAVADAGREQARIEGSNQAPEPLRGIASVATKEVSLPTTTISGPKALRLIAIIDGLLEQTRDEWLPICRASLGEDSPSADKMQEDLNKSLRKVRSHLTQMGFSYDWEFSFLVSDIHLELQVHKALPEAWKEWNQDLDDLLERAVGEANQMVRERRMETLAKVMADGLPTDDYVLGERLLPVAREITEIVIAPALTTGLIENNVVFGVRLGKLIGDIVIRDFIEFARELAQQE